MSVEKTTLFPPPSRGTTLSEPELKYLFSLQARCPLNEIDTTAGPETIALPDPGLEGSESGQSNQNQELIYIKTSADSNHATITGAVGGNQVLTAQTPAAGSCVRFKSNGSVWYVSGKV